MQVLDKIYVSALLTEVFLFCHIDFTNSLNIKLRKVLQFNKRNSNGFNFHYIYGNNKGLLMWFN